MHKTISLAFTLFFSLFLYVNNCFADDIGNGLNNNSQKELKSDNLKLNNDKTETPNVSNEDIFGDEQAFPFIAGLGKNAAH